MWTLQYTCALLLVPPSFSLVSKVIVDEIIIEGVNERVVEMKGFAYPCPKSRGGSCVNLTMIWKVDLPDDTKITMKAAKWVKNDYKLVLLNITKPLKYLMEFEAFSIQSVLRESMRPPALWPLRKNVAYQLNKFHVDASKFPSNFPGGKWLMTDIIEFTNKTKIVTTHWKIVVEHV